MANPFEFLKHEYEGLKQRLKLHQDYRLVFETPEGRAVLHDLLRESGIFATSMDLVNPHNTSYNEGKRKIGLLILQRLRMDNVPALQSLLNEKVANDNQRPREDNDNRNKYHDDPTPILT